MKLKPALFVVGIIILLGIPFIWHDTPSLSKRIDPNKISAWATLLAAAFTSITVYLLYKQNLQQEQAKAAAIQPDLHPSELWIASHNDVFFDVQENELTSPMFKVIGPVVEDGGQFSRKLYGVLHNIGLGAAKEIRVQWLYNEDEVINFIGRSYYIGDNYPMDSAPSQYDFIPASNKINFVLPKKYLLSCGLDFLGANAPAKPTLQLQIIYNDIFNNTIEKVFDTIITSLPSTFILSFKVFSIKTIPFEAKDKKRIHN